MSLEKAPPRPKRSSVEQEEERAWISFYRRVGNDLALATEVLVQLDCDPQMKRMHLALYLCCRQSLQMNRERQARNKRIGQFVRWLCAGLTRQLLAKWPKALVRNLSRGSAVAVECLPETRIEPAIAKANQLAQDPNLANAQANFLQQRHGVAVQPAATNDAIEPAMQPTAAQKAA